MLNNDIFLFKGSISDLQKMPISENNGTSRLKPASQAPGNSNLTENHVLLAVSSSRKNYLNFYEKLFVYSKENHVLCLLVITTSYYF
jgi:hypothetical protein